MLLLIYHLKRTYKSTEITNALIKIFRFVIYNSFFFSSFLNQFLVEILFQGRFIDIPQSFQLTASV